ncbi:MAG: hypothetical protein QQN44_06980 [Nitrosopumilus sp.]
MIQKNFLFDNLYENRKNKPTPGILFKYNGKVEQTKGEEDIVELKGNLINSYKLLDLKNYCKVGSLSPYSRMAGKNTPFAGILLNSLIGPSIPGLDSGFDVNI